MQKPFSGLPVTLFLILGQRKQGDRWVKLDETLGSHSPSMNGHLQKRLGCGQRNAFTGAHPLRSLTSAARPVLAMLRHIRSTVCSFVAVHRTTLAVAQENGGFLSVFCGTYVPEMTSNTLTVHITPFDTRASRNSPGLAESPFFRLHYARRARNYPCK